MKKPLVKKLLVGIPILIVVFLFFTFNQKAYRMDGPSMEPTIENGEKIKARVVPSKDVKHGDIIVFTKSMNGEERRLIKRVVGLPDDTVEISGGEVIVAKADGSIYKPYNDKNTNGTSKTVVKPNSFYVVGDNRANSLDSRIETFGQISFDALQSVVTQP